MRNLYELTVSVLDTLDDDPRHAEITIEPAVNTINYADFGDPDDETLRRVGRYHAGTLGRLAFGLMPWMDLARRDHRCASGGPHVDPDISYSHEPMWLESCHIGGFGLVAPGDEEACQPVLYVHVPVDQRAEWLSRLEAILTSIAREARQ